MSLKREIKRRLLGLFYRKLWVRIAVILLAIVTIPVVLLGALLIQTSQDALRNAVLSDYNQISTRAANEIGLFVKGPQDILNTTGSILSAVYPAPWKQETVLVELVLDNPDFIRAMSVDSSGTALAGSDLGRENPRGYPKEAFEAAIRGKAYISGVNFLDNHTPLVTMAVPVKKTGKVIAALIADVNLRGVWKIADNIKIGKTGIAFLVSDDGTLIAHPDKKRVLRNENLKGQKEVQSVLAGKTESVELEDRSEGKFISAYAPVPGTGWGIVLRQKQEEAYHFSKAMKAQSWTIIILSELLAVLVSMLMARLLARPIKNLASRIKSVAAGNLDHRIDMRIKDDIGELIRSFNYMTKKLKKARERERLSTIGEAAAWIAHELKNSFVSIKSFIQLFPLRHKDELFVDKFRRILPEEVGRMERMFKDLSNFSSQSELRVSRTNVKEIMDGVLEIMKEELSENKINLKYNSHSEEFFIEADAERLREVFQNLIINSINAMPGGGWLTISLDLVTEGVEVKIKDTGSGISKEEQDRLFEPFHTTKNGGMGLGLAISRKIVEQHKGNIRVESGVNRGTIFTLKFPLEVDSGQLKVD
ncbi:MAG: sensor histidine kinase [Candidatus Omnitrophica bacterium]|nr:sensor histidine kinase [Candidatus Omnitrophota bacterium]MDD5552806.1 sensor histidine kinase [Candidatus Omnitrophota bacterium]